MKIILGLTGSVASILAPKLVKALQKIGEVQVILTHSAQHFSPKDKLSVPTHTDEDEWQWKKMGDPILHIELTKWADVLVIAPLSAHTLAKLANGLSSGLLCSTARAWPLNQTPIIVAPAMNTRMWNHPITPMQCSILKDLNYQIIPPVYKTLACGDTGTGAMATIPKIVKAVENTRWKIKKYPNL